MQPTSVHKFSLRYPLLQSPIRRWHFRAGSKTREGPESKPKRQDKMKKKVWIEKEKKGIRWMLWFVIKLTLRT